MNKMIFGAEGFVECEQTKETIDIQDVFSDCFIITYLVSAEVGFEHCELKRLSVLYHLVFLVLLSLYNVAVSDTRRKTNCRQPPGVPLVCAKGLNWHSAEWLWNSIQMTPLAFDLEVVEIWLWLQVTALIGLQMFPLLRPVKSDAVDHPNAVLRLRVAQQSLTRRRLSA